MWTAKTKFRLLLKHFTEFSHCNPIRCQNKINTVKHMMCFRINYGHIVSMLEKAGLDFVDILLVNSDSRPFAEISFIDLASREVCMEFVSKYF